MVRQLRFDSEFELLTTDRCPHNEEWEETEINNDDDDCGDDGDDGNDTDDGDGDSERRYDVVGEDKNESRFKQLGIRALSVLGQLERGQLVGFGYTSLRLIASQAWNHLLMLN
jgi:hypothetical protein